MRRLACRRLITATAFAAAIAPPADTAAQAPADSRFERTLQIGMLDGPEAYTFGSIGAVRLWGADRLLVLDPQSSRAHVYDRAGRHLFSFGASGSGPGEFQRMSSVSFTPDGGVRIHDSRLRRYSTFDHNGRHIETTSLAPGIGTLSSPVQLRSGWWIGEHPMSLSSEHLSAVIAGDTRAGGTGLIRMVVFDGTRADTLMSYEGGHVFWYDAEAGRAFGGMDGVNFGSGGLWAVGGDSLVAVVDARRGRVGWLRSAARTDTGRVALGGLSSVRNVDLGLAATPIGARERQQVERMLRARREPGTLPARIGLILPSAAAHFTRALLDDEGSIWLERRRELSDVASASDTDAPHAARFTIVRLRDGGVREVTLPVGFHLSAVERGLLLGWTRTDLGVPVVQLYR